MGLTRRPLFVCIATTILVAIAIWVPLQMQSIVTPYNDVCEGYFSDERLRELFTIRYQTWVGSFFATGLSLLAIFWLHPAMSLRWSAGITFAIWKTATLFTDTFGSPICWESYQGAGPFWDEPLGTGLMFWLQPLGFASLFATLIGLAFAKWLGLSVIHLKNRQNRAN